MAPIRALACIALLSVVAAAQTRPAFEVATVKPSADQLAAASVGVHISGSQVRTTYLSLKDYISMAYRIPAGQVTGPEWIGQQRFDIAAKVPDGASVEQVPEMMQQLLADRFDLKFHRESKDLPVYALGVARGGIKLQPAAADSSDGADQRPGIVNVAASGSGNGVAVDLGGGSFFSLANNKLEITKATMLQITTTLTRMMDRPVIDLTGVTGRYDLTLDLTPDDYTLALIRSAVNAGVAMPPAALRMLDGALGDPFSGPLEKAGLTLDARKSPLDVIAVDSIRRMPTEN